MGCMFLLICLSGRPRHDEEGKIHGLFAAPTLKMILQPVKKTASLCSVPEQHPAVLTAIRTADEPALCSQAVKSAGFSSELMSPSATTKQAAS